MSLSGLVLAIDTSGSESGAALVATHDPREVLASGYLGADDGRGEALPDCVAEVLKSAGVGAAELAALAVARGPGSFTGVRIALALARGLALVDATPVVGLGSLDLVAMAAPGAPEPACALIGAGRDKVYAAAYRRDRDGAPAEVTAPEVVLDLDLPTFVAAAGDGVALCGERSLLDRVGGGVAGHLDCQAFEVPVRRAEVLATIGAELFARGQGQSADRVLPLYVAAVAARPNTNRVLVSR